MIGGYAHRGLADLQPRQVGDCHGAWPRDASPGGPTGKAGSVTHTAGCGPLNLCVTAGAGPGMPDRSRTPRMRRPPPAVAGGGSTGEARDHPRSYLVAAML